MRSLIVALLRGFDHLSGLFCPRQVSITVTGLSLPAIKEAIEAMMGLEMSRSKTTAVILLECFGKQNASIIFLTSPLPANLPLISELVSPNTSIFSLQFHVPEKPYFKGQSRRDLPAYLPIKYFKSARCLLFDRKSTATYWNTRFESTFNETTR